MTRMPIRAIFDNKPENAGVLSQGTGKIWYEKLAGGIRDVAKSQLPKESNFGFEIDTFIVNVTSYLPWYLSLPLPSPFTPTPLPSTSTSTPSPSQWRHRLDEKEQMLMKWQASDPMPRHRNRDQEKDY